MLINRKWLVLVLIVGSCLLFACSVTHRDSRLQSSHPSTTDLGGYKPSVCTDCHDSQDETFVWEQFNHSVYFARQHKLQANQHEQVCTKCHQRNFCSNCHATRVELKPSLKNQSETFRTMPHRGDYLTRHRIDGRIDPTSCFRCHGNPKTVVTCNKCHG